MTDRKRDVEVRMRWRASIDDVLFKQRLILRCLREGAVVRVSMMLRAREIARHADAEAELAAFISAIDAPVLEPVAFQGRSVRVVLGAAPPPAQGAGARVKAPRPRPPGPLSAAVEEALSGSTITYTETR